MRKPTINIKKIFSMLFWVTIGVSGIVLLVAAVRSKNEKVCKGLEIEISGVSNNFFIDQKDVLTIIKNFEGRDPEGKTISSFNLGAIENNLEKDVWIKNAELFFDNNEILRVYINEREPVARIFSIDGRSFYIDSSLMVLPLSDKFSARLPVFTGFMHHPDFLSKADSNLLADIKELSLELQADSFLMAMIEQVDITPQRDFEMIPKIGNQLIVFGSAEDAAEKLKKLRLFYKVVITKAGWNKYSQINLQYKNQVVAKIKDAADKTSDSLKVLQIMQLIAERAARLAADTTLTFVQRTEKNSADSSMIQQSVQRDEEPDQSTGNNEKPAPPVNDAVPTTVVAPVKMPDTKKTEPKKKTVTVKAAPKKIAPKQTTPPKPAAQKPKAVMN